MNLFYYNNDSNKSTRVDYQDLDYIEFAIEKISSNSSFIGNSSIYWNTVMYSSNKNPGVLSNSRKLRKLNLFSEMQMSFKGIPRLSRFQLSGNFFWMQSC